MISPKSLLFLALQQKINTLVDGSSNKYFRAIDRDFGQIDNFAKPPTVFPSVVIRIVEGKYDDLGTNGQKGVFTVFIRLAFPPYSATGISVPAAYRNKALYYYELEQILFQALHGWAPATVTVESPTTADISGIFGPMMRVMDQEEDREDLLTVIKQAYSITIDDWSASPTVTLTGALPAITDEILAQL
jgi:hypothetical protein